MERHRLADRCPVLRNPEALRYQAPGEWGAILGLDRCPEPKTLRRKLRLLISAEHTVRDLPQAAPDLTKPQAGAPALTLVFDREGWSPDLFKRLARRGIACITWHKNFKGEDWPEEDFRTLEVLIHGPAGTSATTVDLAEKPIVLRNGLTVRQIRRRLANGRQVPVITSHPQMPLVQVAGAMFSRWSQENFFKYLREQFNLDSLPTHDLEPLDPDAQVVNPVRRALEKTIRRVRSRLAAVRNRLVPAQQEPDPDTANRLAADANAVAGELDELQQQRVDTPTHVRAGDLSEQDKLDALPVAGRLFMDVVRMIAYRAETRMMAPVIGAQGKKPNARRSCAGHPADTASRPRQRRLRPHARSPDSGTQRDPHDLSRHRTQAGLRDGRRFVARRVIRFRLRSGSLKLPRTRASPRPDGRRHSLGGRRTVRADRCHEAGAEDG